MASILSADRLRFLLRRLGDRLWVKPLVVCLLSIATVFAAKLADGLAVADLLPRVTVESVETLLSIMSASMLVVATFSVGSMVSAYASASATATPRSFPLIVADDASQNALSTFVGAFIFSIVAITAVKNEYFGTAGLFLLFLLTATVFSVVIFTFVRWVDRIARLGRMGSTIDKVESATANALRRRRKAPTLYGQRSTGPASGRAVYARTVGYVQHIDMRAIQRLAEQAGVEVTIAALPGAFATPARALAFVSPASADHNALDSTALAEAFQIGGDRLFEDDPQFGLIVLSEIASRALSPAVNDPGTAIQIVGTLVRLFVLWSEPPAAASDSTPTYDRVVVPALSVRDMFDDAFASIARDGAGMVEVAVRLQEAMQSLATLGDAETRAAAEHHARLALKRAEIALAVPEDLAAVRAVAGSRTTG
jgi:uncharacterized membrane protein